MNKISQRLRLASALCCLLLAVALMMGCQKRALRGRTEASANGQTYLAVDDDNGGGCGPILVDGKRWPHPIHVPGIISPGPHVIECGGELEFDVEPGTIRHFDYWGP